MTLPGLEIPPAPRNHGLGIIGSRQLVAVQTFDLARLTSHPVVIRPSAFVAVTGQGPRGDSNESGKTSFLAAAGLLLGDPEWRVHGGGVSTVAQLLFEPDTAGVAAHRYPAARLGFIVGVFADPDDVQATAHTVWMRLSSDGHPKYLQVRHAPGVRLVVADTDRERHRLAPGVWASLPAASDLGAQGYTTELYGRSPRCLAYVAARGKQRSGPSLLKLDAGVFTPADIGNALVRLTGRADALEDEAEQRRKLAAVSDDLHTKQQDHDKASREEQATLDAVALRNRVRAILSDGQQLWHLHMARGLLDVLARRGDREQTVEATAAQVADTAAEQERARAAETALGDDQHAREALTAAEERFDVADQELNEAREVETTLRNRVGWLREQLRNLESRGARDAHLSVESAQEQLEARVGERARADATAAGLAAEVSDVERQLADAEQGRHGTAGVALRVLDDARIAAVGLMDVCEVAADARSEWEPRLHLWRDAVCIDRDDREDALLALRGVPGAVVIFGDPNQMGTVERIRQSPPTARTFLRVLMERMDAATVERDGVAVRVATDTDPGVTVIGDFAEPTTGRQHLIRALQARLDRTRELARASAAQAKLAKQHEDAARDALTRAEAAAEHAELTAQLTTIEETKLPAASGRITELLTPRHEAFEAVSDAKATLRSLEATRQRAKSAREDAEREHQTAVRDHRKAKDHLEAVSLAYWTAGFGGTETDARTALNWADGPLELDSRDYAAVAPPRDPGQPVERRTNDTLRNRAAEKLVEALTVLDVDRSTGDRAPSADIAKAVRERENLADADGTPLARDEVSFVPLAQALGEWLDQYVERDQLAEERIGTARRTRQQEIDFVQSKHNGLVAGLANIQDDIEQRIEASLGAISDALDRLNRDAQGSGATLDWTSIRPAGPTDRWIWQVVPKWRRSPGGKMLPYDNATNSAQEKLFSVHLVLAALLASPDPHGRVLILDELGDSLGDEHRRDVLQAVRRVAEQHGITVLGTCQDAVMPDAASYCGEILYFCYPSKTEALNLPTRMFAYDNNRARVELTAEALLAGRPWT